MMLDLAHSEQGEIGKAIATAEECRRLGEQAGFAEGLHSTNLDAVLI